MADGVPRNADTGEAIPQTFIDGATVAVAIDVAGHAGREFGRRPTGELASTDEPVTFHVFVDGKCLTYRRAQMIVDRELAHGCVRLPSGRVIDLGWD